MPPNCCPSLTLPRHALASQNVLSKAGGGTGCTKLGAEVEKKGGRQHEAEDREAREAERGYQRTAWHLNDSCAAGFVILARLESKYRVFFPRAWALEVRRQACHTQQPLTSACRPSSSRPCRQTGGCCCCWPQAAPAGAAAAASPRAAPRLPQAPQPPPPLPPRPRRCRCCQPAGRGRRAKMGQVGACASGAHCCFSLRAVLRSCSRCHCEHQPELALPAGCPAAHCRSGQHLSGKCTANRAYATQH